MRVCRLYIVLWTNKTIWRKLWSTTQLTKLTAAFFVSFFFFSPSSFQSREQGSVFEESSCWNRAAVCASCALFHVPVVQNGLCSAHPNNRKVVSLSFLTVFIYKRVLFLIPSDALSWKVGVWVGRIGHSSAKTTFKSYFRHFCGLIWLYLVV